MGKRKLQASMESRRRTLSKLTCVECGEFVEEQWVVDNNLRVPLCPECCKKLKHLFELKVAVPSEFTVRCNLK